MVTMDKLHNLIEHDDVLGFKKELANNQDENNRNICQSGEELIGLFEFNSVQIDEIVSEALRHEAFGCLQELISHPNMSTKYIRDKSGRIIQSVLEHPGVYFQNAHYNSDQYKECSLWVVQTVCQRLSEADDDVEDFDDTDELDEKVSRAVKTIFATWKGAYSPMLLAIYGNNFPVVHYFMAKGIDINIYSDSNKLCRDSPIIAAIVASKVDIVKYMLQNGTLLCSEVERTGDEFLPSTIGHCINWCLDKHALDQRGDVEKFKTKDDLLHTMITSATATNPIHIEDLSVMFKDYRPLFTQAWLEGKLTNVSTSSLPYNNRKIDLNQLIFGQVLASCNYKNVKLVLTNKEVLSLDINDVVIKKRDENIWRGMLPLNSDFEYLTPLQYILCLNWKITILKTLLDHGVDTNGHGDLGIHPLCLISLLCCREEKLVLDKDGLQHLTILLRYGCDLNSSIILNSQSAGPCSVSLLEHFARQGNLPMCKVLLAAGANKYDQQIVDRKDLEDVVHTYTTFGSSFKLHQYFDYDEINNFMYREQQHISNLQKQARTIIRSMLSGNIEKSIKCLQLPNRIKDYLNLSELDDAENFCTNIVGRQQF